MTTILNGRAKTYDKIKPLIDHCRAGRLFDVQDWIAAGKPVNLPLRPAKKARKKCPLRVAMEKGFHSLVQVLLEAGAQITDGSFNALDLALMDRRLDLIELLVAHGADVNSVSMVSVFETWDPAIMDYFIDQGADVETDSPLAGALCWKIRTALGVFKRHKDRFPSFQDQINMALRYHCSKGDLKWVSLLLWAGADPYAQLQSMSGEINDPEQDLCGLEIAAQNGHFEVLKLKNIRLIPDHPIAENLMRFTCQAGNADFLTELISQGFDPTRHKDRGSSLIMTSICCLQWSFEWAWLDRHKLLSDTATRPRDNLKTIQILFEHGVKWTPIDRGEINHVRRALLKVSAECIVDLVGIMAQHNGCSRDVIVQLMGTAAMRRHVAEHQSRIEELIMGFSQSMEIKD